MFEDPNAGGGTTSDPPVGTGGGTATGDTTGSTSDTTKSISTEDVSAFQDPATSGDTGDSADSDPPVGTGGG